MILIVLLFDDLVLFSLCLEALKSFVGLETRLKRTVLLESITELFNLFDEGLDAEDEFLLEVCLLLVHLIADDVSLLNKAHPAFVKLVFIIAFILVHDLDEVRLEESVHLVDRSNLMAEVALLLTDFFESGHDATKRVNVLDFLVNLKANLFNVIS